MDRDDYRHELQQIEGQLAQLVEDVRQIRREMGTISSEVQTSGVVVPPLLKGVNTWTFLTFATILAYVVHVW